MKKYKVGIIGCGRMGWLFNEDKLIGQPVSHISAYAMNKKAEVAAVCDIDQAMLDGISKKYNIRNTYIDYKEMLKKEKFDIVSISAPTRLHSEICAEAAESGVRAIFSEKPIATSLEEAEFMVDICKRNNVKLAVNHTRRWDPSFNAVKKILNEGTIGEVNLITAFATVGLANSGTHLFDLLRYYFGDAASVSGTIITDGSTDPGGRGFIKFKNGLLCLVDSSYRDYVLFGANVYGSKGMIEIGGQIRGGKVFNLLMGRKSSQESGIKELRPVQYKAPKWTSPIVNAVENIVHSIEGKEEILCTGEDGKAALEIALAFHESSMARGKVVTLPLENKNLSIVPRETSFTKDGRLK